MADAASYRCAILLLIPKKIMKKVAKCPVNFPDCSKNHLKFLIYSSSLRVLPLFPWWRIVVKESLGMRGKRSILFILMLPLCCLSWSRKCVACKKTSTRRIRLSVTCPRRRSNRQAEPALHVCERWRTWLDFVLVITRWNKQSHVHPYNNHLKRIYECPLFPSKDTNYSLTVGD